jgi:WD40 repeat protein
LWSLVNHKAGEPLHIPAFRVRSAAPSPDGRFILVGGGVDKGKALLCDTQSRAPLAPPLEDQEVVWQVAFSSVGCTCAIASGANDVCLWDIGPDDRSHLRYRLPPAHQARVVTLAFSPDGRTLLTGSTDMTARLWDVSGATAARPLGEPLQHPGAVWSAAFSADGRTIVTGCRDGRARLWDAATATPVGPPLAHDDVVWAIACHPRDTLVLTGSADKTARLWRLPEPMEGDPERIKLWVQLSTGMTLDDSGVSHWLDPDAWRKCQRQLHDLGQPRLPLPPAR